MYIFNLHTCIPEKKVKSFLKKDTVLPAIKLYNNKLCIYYIYTCIEM